MGKISQVSSKYIINATIEIEGVVERPDVIGAIFGQTEGLLGTELELRELQRSGRIGRIEVNLTTKDGKTAGQIIIPSSLDKTETSIIGAALEIIQRIGPCNAKVKVGNIEDVRISKRAYVLDRAKELLKDMVEGVIPDSQELADTVSDSVKVQGIVEYGPERLASGPGIEEAKEVIVVEGRADVGNLLRSGIQNVIAMNGTSCPDTIKELGKTKELTLFVDGDRGGDLILQGMMGVADVAFVTKAPDGKEVEELTSKEIHKALRSKITAAEAKKQYGAAKTSLRRKNIASADTEERRPSRGRGREERGEERGPSRDSRGPRREMRDDRRRPVRQARLNEETKQAFKEQLDSLIGTRGALIFDSGLKVLGRVPVTELSKTLESLKGSDADTIIFDGIIDDEILDAADRGRIKTLVANENQSSLNSRVRVITADQL